MGFSRHATTPAREAVDHFTQGVTSLKHAGYAAARGTRDAAAPRVNVVLTKVGLKKPPAPKWPWVAGAIGAGLALGGAAFYVWYRQRTESIGEQLLADELLDDSELDDRALSEELVDSVTR
ncbi:hypothetical protein [Glycomyces harbinensis]|uniref:Uncharacterized protein n=1 Tax=Glycomyces harbinensis TaxID=58114 RepID=A0A1G7DBB7_9ACTN|nr:hypothetical protein [Glycomyces harbinensis]SDE48035.1 hypothetical protein SAMN05216270_12374 [Glycomyces harbinensis]